MFDTADAAGGGTPSRAAVQAARLDAVESEITVLAASIAAAEGRLARLFGEFVEAGGTDRWEVTPARWASWKLGLGTAEAHRLVALAARLRELPRLVEACESGSVSASLAGTLARAATPATEDDLVELAHSLAPSKVERICRTRARLAAAAAGDGADPVPAAVPPPRHATSGVTDDGLGWELHAELAPYEGARVDLALDRALDWLRGAGAPADPAPIASVALGGRRPTRADALLLLAETVLAEGPRERQASDRHQVVVHVDLDRYAAALAAAGGAAAPDHAAAHLAAHLSAHLANGGALDAATLGRLACDSRLVVLFEREGRPVRIGDPTTAIPAHIRRAVLARDGHACAHPTCGAVRGLEVHHVVHRAHGGRHDPDLLVTLCWADHQAHHRGRFGIEPADRAGTFRFTRPDGSTIAGRPPPAPGPAPPLEQLGVTTIDPAWAGNRPYGDRVTWWGLDMVVEHLARLDERFAGT